MNIKKKRYDCKMIVEVSGRLDVESAHELEKELSRNISEIEELVLDFKDLEYISSSGIRIILSLQNALQKRGKLVIKNVNDFVLDVLKTTKIVEVLEVQKKMLS
ncbi:MAG: STAS domain-containing protein [Methanobrevibacter sp.]|jgi:anti-sigma B factor antagonist|nr:STAS domain-containing protein [Candidatus Methanovirga basalitermitum]